LAFLHVAATTKDLLFLMMVQITTAVDRLRDIRLFFIPSDEESDEVPSGLLVQRE
jgi:hypothetical protein